MGWEIWTYIENMWESKVWGNHDKLINIDKVSNVAEYWVWDNTTSTGILSKAFLSALVRSKNLFFQSESMKVGPGPLFARANWPPKVTKHDKTNHEKTNCPPIQSDPWWTQKSCPAGPAFAVLLLPPLSSEHFSLPSEVESLKRWKPALVPFIPFIPGPSPTWMPSRGGTALPGRNGWFNDSGPVASLEFSEGKEHPCRTKSMEKPIHLKTT